MRTLWLSLMTLSVSFVMSGQAPQCTTIQSGKLVGSDGTTLKTGVDKWGYDYQAMTFKGRYCDADRDAEWCQQWKDDDLQMQWNKAWLSNQDCDGDGLLDRHPDFESYKGSGAGLIIRQKGVYTDENGKQQQWDYFVKIVAVPFNASLSGDTWSTYDYYEAKDDVVIGPAIWGDCAIAIEEYNDTGTGEHEVLYHNPRSTRFDSYGPQQ